MSRTFRTWLRPAGWLLPLLLFWGCGGVQPHEKLHSVLWMQQSAEYRASTLQAYRTATQNLAQALADPAGWPSAVETQAAYAAKPLAVIVDVDETLLDNSPAEVANILADRREFDVATWKEWERRAEAKAIQGAGAFAQWASSHQVAVFYVTNRFDEEAVRKNLISRQFPIEDSEDRVRLPGECAGGDRSTDKECRRQDIAAKYHVALLVGDDLGDFFSVKDLTVAARLERGRAAESRWGREWIVIPNPTYGSWERAFYEPGRDDGATILLKKRQGLDAGGSPAGQP
ncbi:MAG: hypothetical protein KF814_06575 [Nitrospiraceae bacterium]|nr:hypothetical protein [Nitrospiraceae bacterium]